MSNVASPSIDLPVPARVLAVAAHSDDMEFGCGATLAKWSEGGAEVHLLVLTDGSKGSWDPAVDLNALVAARRVEQEAAAAVLGLTGVVFFDLVDGELGSGLSERARVCELIRRVRPDVVLGHDPWKRYRVHPDHRHAGWLVIDGVAASRDPHFFPEQGLAPHRPRSLLLFEAEEVDHLERVDGFLDRKIDALLCHRSQWRSTMGIEGDGPESAVQRERFVARVRTQAERAGSPVGVELAESFKLLDQL